jgi:tetraacyldisaccharide 4'-kinase
VSRLFNEIWYGRHPLKWLLWPVSVVFAIAVRTRRRMYRDGRITSVELDVPVIVVGNISVGGTGKTPCVIWLARELRRRGLRVGVVTRGYGATNREWPRRVHPESPAQELGDEAVLIARRTACAVAAGPDRVAAARLLLEEGPIDVLVSDDGLQHYRLGRAFEIAVVDGVRGLGNGLCLPAGPLREAAARLEEVDAVVVNSGPWGHAGVMRAELVPTRLYNVASGESRPLASLRGVAVHAVAGIGHPERFFSALRAIGLDVDEHALPDHARLKARDLVFGDDKPVMITEKDAVKCGAFAHERVWCVVAELRFATGDDERLMRLLMRGLSNKEKSP